jgi:2-polyprenyl-3-methyl-5-hydroxy-6-metoxy-1,4-benzoquinol methylase
MNTGKLQATEKKIQMNDKYSKAGSSLFESNLHAKHDLQGWRNLLVDKASKFANKAITLDMGCGYGDKTYRMLMKSDIAIKKSYLVDFSKAATKVFKEKYKENKVIVYNDDAISALKSIKNKEVDIVLLFGFIHEVEDREKLIDMLKDKLSEECLVLFSDNILYFNAKDIFSDLNRLSLPGTTFKKVFKLGMFHIYKSKSSINGKSKYVFFRHVGRMDEVFGIFGKKHREFFKFNIYGSIK